MNSQHAIKEMVKFNHCVGIKLNEICTPIFNNFGFDSFAYTRIYTDGRRLILDTNKEWLEYYSESQFMEVDHGNGSIIHNLSSLLLTSKEIHIAPFFIRNHLSALSSVADYAVHEYLLNCGILNSVSIYIRLEDFVEIYHFTSSKDDPSMVIDLCINKRHLNRFLHYFREKLLGLDIEQGPYVQAENLAQIITQPYTGMDSKQVKNYLKQTRISKFFLKGQQQFISRREAECLHYISMGRSSKEIARILNISPRTVENHIQALKIKTAALTKGNLINIAEENHMNNKDFLLAIHDDY